MTAAAWVPLPRPTAGRPRGDEADPAISRPQCPEFPSSRVRSVGVRHAGTLLLRWPVQGWWAGWEPGWLVAAAPRLETGQGGAGDERARRLCQQVRIDQGDRRTHRRAAATAGHAGPGAAGARPRRPGRLRRLRDR